MYVHAHGSVRHSFALGCYLIVVDLIGVKELEREMKEKEEQMERDRIKRIQDEEERRRLEM